MIAAIFCHSGKLAQLLIPFYHFCFIIKTCKSDILMDAASILLSYYPSNVSQCILSQSLKFPTLSEGIDQIVISHIKLSLKSHFVFNTIQNL